MSLETYEAVSKKLIQLKNKTSYFSGIQRCTFISPPIVSGNISFSTFPGVLGYKNASMSLQVDPENYFNGTQRFTLILPPSVSRRISFLTRSARSMHERRIKMALFRHFRAFLVTKTFP